MNFDDSILAKRADAPFATRASDDTEFGEIFGKGVRAGGISKKFLAFLSFGYQLRFGYHTGEAIFEERNLLKIIHRFQELSPVSPQIYQQVYRRIVAFLFGIRTELA